MLISKHNKAKDDVKIFWKHGTVKINGEKVASVLDGWKFNLFGEGEALQQELTDAMELWFEKNGADSPFN